MFRAIHDEEFSFSEKKKPSIASLAFNRIPISNSDELIDVLRLKSKKKKSLPMVKLL